MAQYDRVADRYLVPGIEWNQLQAEVRRLREIEERVERLLAECDRNEAHIRAHVPHLPPDGGSFSVHVIRKFLRTET